ncbi:imidazole glycerol phosphate synthase subunit HisF [Thiomicrorhabdus sediminis]|uniref:imidazole glycerol-phosphate synthase n=1 Tax=Thiomicrorhabdus sediminis TaxID=2580412 RepID=A0A4P9K601_9GAMM|nr:imidazole glycerol phosphate synthase cyclase subunit [Thiomicrorhabdus sediminis]QCU90474.1 imidazole glycerol phosphate synthase subunit HisF [Thiomicrorhabdus sediminis]
MIRLIPRLDIKSSHLIKGVKLEGLRKIGNPNDYARKYYEQGADELLYMDAVASLYGRNSLTDIVKETVKSVFIPITVGGGIRSVDDAREILRCGADKVAINTAAVQRPELIAEMAQAFGSQCVVLSVEAIKQADGKWLAFTDNGREHTGLDVVEWVKKAVDLGAGEVLLTSVDREGGRKGYDLDLINAVCKEVSVPVIASGGMGEAEHGVDAVKSGASAIAMADILHYERDTVSGIREVCADNGLDVRPQSAILEVSA